MPERVTPSAAVSVEVLVAAAFFALTAAAAVCAAVPDAPSVLLLAGWPMFALVDGAVLDVQPGCRLGRVLLSISVVPVLVLVASCAQAGGLPTSATMTRSVAALAGVQVVAPAILLPFAFHHPRAPVRARASAALASVGALTVLVSHAGSDGGVLRFAGWALLIVGCAALLAQIGGEAAHEDRAATRRMTWLLLTLTVAGFVAAATWLLPTDLTPYVVCFDLWVTGLVVVRLHFIEVFRPMSDHALDLAALLSVIGAATLVAAMVRIGVGWTRLESPTTFAAFSGLFTAVVYVPVALRTRRVLLARRYGTGTLSPADVAVITADLHAQREPRTLLDKAATMVATASGSREARIVLGVETPAVPDHWVIQPLVVGGDQVGALLVESAHAEGLELRQQQIVSQLMPTVALVARAVGLAVEAEHARRDVARERDAERTRILGDLHDGLGPVLAGMSMRVLAMLRTTPDAQHVDLLHELAADLARSRTDLRRLVAGITPSVLDDGDLESALVRLVQSFQGGTGGPQVSLGLALDVTLPLPVQVAVYRSVAEGLTNALRHARATRIDVTVRSVEGSVVVHVDDDGVGGPVVPGVGLSSLRHRADILGGDLRLGSGEPSGTRLHLTLPVREEARA